MSDAARTLLNELQRLSREAKTYPRIDKLEELCNALGNDPRFSHLDATEVFQKAKATINQNPANLDAAVSTLHEMMIGGGRNDIHLSKLLNSGQAASEAEATVVKQLYSSASTNYSYSSSGASSHPVSTIDRITAQWEGLTTQDKVGIAMSYICAAMAMISSVSRFSNALQKDENGKNHVVASNLFWGTTSALLAAGMAYLGHSQFKAVVR